MSSSSSNNFGTMAEAETEAADVKYSGKEVSFIAVRPSAAAAAAVRKRFTRCSGRADEPSSSLDNCCCCVQFRGGVALVQHLGFAVRVRVGTEGFCCCRRTSLELQFFAVDFVEVP